MIRTVNTRLFSQGQLLRAPLRLASTQTAKASESKFQDEWDNAKPFESIPAMTKLQAIRNFLPGGNLLCWGLSKFILPSLYFYFYHR